jgi:hypothetical protein
MIVTSAGAVTGAGFSLSSSSNAISSNVDVISLGIIMIASLLRTNVTLAITTHFQTIIGISIRHQHLRLPK